MLQPASSRAGSISRNGERPRVEEFAVFFDVAGTLGIPAGFDPDLRLRGLQVYPFVEGLLSTMWKRGVRLGIIANTSNHETVANMRRVLEEAQIYSWFDPGLLLYSSIEGVRKVSPAIFQLAAERSGLAGETDRCVFVGEDFTEGRHAQDAGFCYIPHPRLLEEKLATFRG